MSSGSWAVERAASMPELACDHGPRCTLEHHDVSCFASARPAVAAALGEAKRAGAQLASDAAEILLDRLKGELEDAKEYGENCDLIIGEKQEFWDEALRERDAARAELAEARGILATTADRLNTALREASISEVGSPYTSFAIRDGIVSLYDWGARLRSDRDAARAELAEARGERDEAERLRKVNLNQYAQEGQRRMDAESRAAALEGAVKGVLADYDNTVDASCEPGGNWQSSWEISGDTIEACSRALSARSKPDMEKIKRIGDDDE